MTKEINSYIAQKLPMGKGLAVVPTHWQVGYTPAHQETPIEALEYSINKKTREIHQLNEDIEILKQLIKEQ